MPVEPFTLYVSKRFLDKASKSFSLGFIVRKPLVEILKKMNVSFKELEREEAKAALEGIELKGVAVSVSQLIKKMAIVFFVPGSLVLAAMKKVHYRSGIETEDSIILELLAEIPRALRPSLFYDIWLVVPKTEAGEENTKRLIKTIVDKVGVPPLNEEEWENLQPIIEKLKGQLELKGLTENIWEKI